MFERLPIFDESTVVEELDGDREVLFEILELYREKLQDSYERLGELSPGHPEFRETIREIGDHATRIRATRLAELAHLLLTPAPEVELPHAARARLLRETERFLRETQFVL